MALIKCNECGREISDKAGACPGCGAPVKASIVPDATIPVSIVETRTPIGEAKKDTSNGVGLIAFGVIMGIGGLFLLLIFFPIGIAALFLAFGFIATGRSRMALHLPITCPYCKKQGDIDQTATSYKCPFCKKTSVRNDEYMERV